MAEPWGKERDTAAGYREMQVSPVDAVLPIGTAPLLGRKYPGHLLLSFWRNP